MATLQTSSRLELLQAWFQQRQLVEKERKLLQIYDQQQQRAHKVAQRGSAGSDTSNGSERNNSRTAVSHQVVTKTTNTANAKTNPLGGKVRQMFDERRQTTIKGIDKSYPLTPLENETKRVNGTVSIKNINKNSVATRKNVVAKRTSGEVPNGNISKGNKPIVSYHEEVTQETFGLKLIYEDINKFYNMDVTTDNRNYHHIKDVNTRNGSKKYNHVISKMPVRSVKKTSNKDNNSNLGQLSTLGTTSIAIDSRMTRNSNLDITTKVDSLSTQFVNGTNLKIEKKLSSPKLSSEIQHISSSISSRRTFITSTSPTDNNNNGSHNLNQDTTINPPNIVITMRSQSTTSANRSIPPSNHRNNVSAINDSNVSCQICDRSFAPDRINLHERICAKTKQKKRKTFDVMNQRVKGTEMESFLKRTMKKGHTELKIKKSETKSNWRRKHEDFINAIRSAKQVQAHLAAGGKISDLPPPPPNDISDYIQCSYCGRKFNQTAAERHIPKCEHMLHNKPNSRALPKFKR